MEPLQFTLRDLFLMTTLVAIGMGGIAWALRWERFDINPTLWMAWVLASTALIVAGIVVPFRSRWNKIWHYGMLVCRISIAVICLVFGIVELLALPVFIASGQQDWVKITIGFTMLLFIAAIVFFPKKFRE